MKKISKKTGQIIKTIISILKKNKYEIILAILVIAAAFLRIYKQAEYIDFFGDVGRDMIVAKHIAEDMKWTTAKPYSAAAPYLENSILYFNLLGFFWFLFPSILSINMAHTILSLIVIIFGYLIGRELSDKTTGLIIATYFTFSFYFIHISRFIWQPNLIPYFLLAGLYLFVKYLKKTKIIHLYWSILYLWLCLNIHYSILILLPITSFWIVKKYYERLKVQKINKITSNLSFLLYLFSLFITWITLTNIKVEKLISVFINSNKTHSITHIIQHILDTIVLFSKFLYGNHDFSIIIYIIFIAVIILSLTNKNIKTSESINFIYSLNFSIAIAFFLEKNNNIHYYGPLIMIAYISSALLIRSIKNKLLKIIFFVVLLILFLHSTLNDNKIVGLQTYFEKWERNDYLIAKKISKMIVNDYQSKNPNDLSFNLKINRYISNEVADTGQYYIFLEEITKKRLLDVTEHYTFYDFDAGNNLQIIEKNPKITYIVCFRFPSNSHIYNNCLKPAFDKMITIDKDFIEIEKIIEIPQHREYTSLYRITPMSNK